MAPDPAPATVASTMTARKRSERRAKFAGRRFGRRNLVSSCAREPEFHSGGIQGFMVEQLRAMIRCGQQTKVYGYLCFDGPGVGLSLAREVQKHLSSLCRSVAPVGECHLVGGCEERGCVRAIALESSG